jgi:ABC-type sugar transport system permease subunit
MKVIPGPRPETARAVGGARNQHRLAPYLFLTPFAVLFRVCFAYPVGYAFYLRLFRRYDDLMGSPRRAACAPQSRRLDYCQWRTDPSRTGTMESPVCL